jgi:hypothetical protein
MGNFASDLLFGKVYEDEAIRLMKQQLLLDEANAVLERPVGKFSSYDFSLGGVQYEVKADRYAHRTQCMFLEYECNGRPSGVSVTTASFWMYFVVKGSAFEVYKIPVSELTKDKSIRSVSGGDGGRVRGYIIPLSCFAQYKLKTGE